MREGFITLGAAALLAVVLASCGSAAETTTTTAATVGATTTQTQTDAEPSSTTTTTAAPTTLNTADGGGSVEDGGALTIRATDELRFEPDAITMSPGQQVELTFRNAGSVQHSLAVLNLDAELEHVLSETDEEHLHEELYFDIHEQSGGDSITETFTAPSDPGEYVFACLVPGHAGAGMVGTLTVR